MPWFYYFSIIILKIILSVFTRWQVNGRENIPHKGPLLVVANHLNNADPPLVAVSITRRASFMAKEELFRSKLIGHFIGSFGAFPVHRGQLDRKAVRQTEQVLARGGVLVMFPEAHRSENGKLQPALPGAALVALHSGAPILPVAITGTEKFKGAGWVWQRPRITVNIGRPFLLASGNGKVVKTELAIFTNTIMQHIAELLPEEYRGYYARQG